jgi:hypothetical protein
MIVPPFDPDQRVKLHRSPAFARLIGWGGVQGPEALRPSVAPVTTLGRPHVRCAVMQPTHTWRRRVLIAVVGFALTACTPQQLADFVAWHEQDPAAAEAFANLPEVQALLVEQPSEPEPVRGVWDRVAQCESGQNWSYNGGSGYDGGLQFLPATWRAYGGREFAEYAWQASRVQQITVAERVLADAGWRAWPTCSRKLGLR